jgi:hypothetical protein
MTKKLNVIYLFSVILIFVVALIFLNFKTVSAEEENNFIVHSFEINGETEALTIAFDEETVVKATVENVGKTDSVLKLMMNGREHYHNWEIKAGEIKEIETESYGHSGWYEGVFVMSLADKEIEVKVTDNNKKDDIDNNLIINSFKVNKQSQNIRLNENERVNITAEITNHSDKTAEIKLVVAKKIEFAPISQPWPYKELDVEKVRILGYQGHHENSCSYGAFNAIISTLQSEIGHPYTQIPTYMLHFGRGGFVEQGSVCGAMIGSVAAINLITGEDYRPLAEELIKYYKEENLPTEVWNLYLEEEGSSLNSNIDDVSTSSLTGSVAQEVDCRKSLQEWYSAVPKADGSEKHERCARLTGDVAAKATELLNEWSRNRKINLSADQVNASNEEFSKSYQIRPRETLNIDEVLTHNWGPYIELSVSLGNLESQEVINLTITDRNEKNNKFYNVALMSFLFISGIVLGLLMKK